MDFYGETALHVASRAGHIDCITLLLREGAAPNGSDAFEAWMLLDDRVMTPCSPPLHLSAAGNHVACVKALLAAGASHERTGDTGCTPLHCATAAGCHAAMSALMAAGADPFAICHSNGGEPLFFAVERSDARAASVLLASWAAVKPDVRAIVQDMAWRCLRYWPEEDQWASAEANADADVRRWACLEELLLHGVRLAAVPTNIHDPLEIPCLSRGQVAPTAALLARVCVLPGADHPLQPTVEMAETSN